jgi:hypothetical protein
MILHFVFGRDTDIDIMCVVSLAVSWFIFIMIDLESSCKHRKICTHLQEWMDLNLIYFNLICIFGPGEG